MSEYENPLAVRILEVVVGIFFICAFLFFFIGMILFIIDQATEKRMGYKMTECYDKFSNEIIELECEEEVKCGVVSEKWFNEEYCKSAEYKTSQKRRKGK